MIKKIIVWSLIATGVVFVVGHVRPGAVHTFMRRAQTRLERTISPEFELARIKDQIAQLTPDMYKNIDGIARKMVEVESLDRKIGDLQVKLDTSKSELAVLTQAIDRGVTRVNLGGREVPVTQITHKLQTYRSLEREVASLRKVYEAKKSGVDAARQQLTEVKRQKEELEAMAAQFEADLQTLALEQTRNKVQFDDTRLAEIKESFEKLRERIEVERKKSDLTEQFRADAISPEKKPAASTKDAVEEAREYLGTDKAKIDATGK